MDNNITKTHNRVYDIEQLLDMVENLQHLEDTKSESYYRLGDILIKVYGWGENHDLSEIKMRLRDALNVEEEIQKDILKYLEKTTLPIFQLTTISLGSRLTPNNITIWEYERFIGGKKESNPALRNAFLNTMYHPLIITCEFTEPGDKTMQNVVDEVTNKISELEEELLQATNKPYTELEIIM